MGNLARQISERYFLAASLPVLAWRNSELKNAAISLSGTRKFEPAMEQRPQNQLNKWRMLVAVEIS